MLLFIGNICRRFSFLILILLPGNTFQNKAPDPAFYLGGIQMSDKDPDTFMRLVKEIGMNTIEFTHYAVQAAWNSDELDIHLEKDKIIDQIRLAKQHDLEVVLILRVDLEEPLDENRFLWHGMIMPGNETMIRSWFDKYERYVLSWAEICEREEVDMLVIGSELNTLASTIHIKQLPDLYKYYLDKKAQRVHEGRILQFKNHIMSSSLWNRAKRDFASIEEYVKLKIDAQHEWAKQVCFNDSKHSLDLMNKRRTLISEEWDSLIGSCRKLYSGDLGYAGNFDSYKEFGSWDKIDFIGINAYFPLLKKMSACDELTCYEEKTFKEWNKILKDIASFQKEQGLEDKAVIFTELGYINREGATSRPWKGFGYSILKGRFREKLVIWEEQPINYSERTGAVLGLYKAVRKRSFPLKGILYWKLTTREEDLYTEPFGLQIKDPAKDPLQEALLKFVD